MKTIKETLNIIIFFGIGVGMQTPFVVSMMYAMDMRNSGTLEEWRMWLVLVCLGFAMGAVTALLMKNKEYLKLF